MSISAQIDRLSTNIINSLAALVDKGVVVSDGSNVDDLAELIAAIEDGGSELTKDSGSFSPTSAINTYTIEHDIGVIPKYVIVTGNSLSATPSSGSPRPFMLGVRTPLFSIALVGYYQSSGNRAYRYVDISENSDLFISSIDEESVTLSIGDLVTAKFYSGKTTSWYVWG